MTISIPNAGQMNLSALVGQLGKTDDTKELRSHAGAQGAGTVLYTKSIFSNLRPSAERVVEREKHQENARADITSALFNQFGDKIGNKVMNNMTGFFQGGSIVTAGDARAVLETATVFQAVEARRAEAGNVTSLLDPQGHPALSNAFLAFATNEYSPENYQFVQQARACQALPYATPSEITQKDAQAALIFQTFGPQGHSPINVSGPESLNAAAYGNLSPADKNTYFDVAMGEITKLMNLDTVGRWMKSDLAKNYINNG